jgi:uncharacterized protein YdhG (YjbR/CyaY superfamily)
VNTVRTVDDYISSFPTELQPRLNELRALSRSHAPSADEGLKWGEPAYSTGTILFMWGAYKRHANFVFTPSTKDAFGDALIGFETGKGSVKIPHDEPVPTDVLASMIRHRVREFEDQGVLCR